ncbi:MAG: 8-amino-7-oxononanoate synthase [Candidatus Hydrogenedentes bacterium]|nr:8-amino-7-oxononanoate synthase [Candidatus Hydrogenedentota bacterium]
MSSHPYEHILQAIRDDHRWRALRSWPGAGGIIHKDGRRLLNFSSNDYLDLANAPALKQAVREALDAYGCGATASRLMSGDLDIHRNLEQAIAQLTGQASALVFPSGYQANVGVLQALAGRDDAIFSDALNHASIIDGARLSRAAIHVYRHADTDHLAELLDAAPPTGRKIIVTDSVFSMDGDLAPLEAIAGLARSAGAVLVVDEAHALGVWGGGGGLCRALGVTPDLITGTFGKAFGAGGAFAAGSAPYRDLLINTARSFIFSTGLTPMNAAAARAAVRAVADHPGWGDELRAQSALFQAELRARGVPVQPSETQIVPVPVGDNQRAVDLGAALLDRDIIATGIRPPTVPPGTARLRFSVTRAHSEDDLRHAAAAVAEALDV